MKIYLDYPEHNTKPDLSEDRKMVLENIKVFKNSKNQWCVQFKTKNHKYLDIRGGMSSSHVNGEYCEHGAAQGFELSTDETYYSEEADYDFPEQTAYLYLIPESKEEKEEVSGVCAILPEKWRYSICIVPFEDFYN